MGNDTASTMRPEIPPIEQAIPLLHVVVLFQS